MSKLLYLDSSSFLTLLLQQGDHARVEASVDTHQSAGGRICSSRLLWLEAARVGIREHIAGRDLRDLITTNLKPLDRMPVTEDVWALAAGIQQHVRTLDAIHLATCELAGATLLTPGLDNNIHQVAKARGIPLHY